METNLSIIKFGVVFLTLILSDNLIAQNAFSCSILVKSKKIGLLSYDGNLKSIADYETSKVPSFTFLSVGKVKKTIAVSNGCVYVLIEYPKEQYILVRSIGNASALPCGNAEWKDIENRTLNACLALGCLLYTSPSPRD